MLCEIHTAKHRKLYGKTVIFVSHEIVLILDFGGQYNQLIARRVRDMGIYCEIIPWRKATVETIKEKNPIGIIFTGGPNSVYLETSTH